MRAQNRFHLSRVLTYCCAGLFQGLGLPIDPEPSFGPLSIPDKGMVAFIGLTGANIRGYLLVAAPLQLVQVVCPPLAPGEPVTEENLYDWLGELANQLAGRLKIRLGAVGLPFEISCPTTMAGSQMHTGAGELLLFHVPPHTLSIRLDAVLSPGFVLPDALAPEALPCREGDLVLFD